MTLGVGVLIICNLLVNVGVNRWYRWFYDALEARDKGALTAASIAFLVLVIVGAGVAVALVKTKMTLQFTWRRWMTDKVIDRWLSDQRYYKLAISDDTVTSPESRITDDIRLATEPLVEFAIGFTNAILAAVAFGGILFVVGGSLQIGGVTIPGYIAMAAVVYSLVVSSATFKVGSPLAQAVDHRCESEAQFRAGMTRVRENLESIALIRGDEDELRRARERFEKIARRNAEVIRHLGRLTWVLNGNAIFAAVFALLLAAPKYLAGELTLGAMIQLGAAFVSVLGALNWFAENYIAVALWRASARRVALLDNALHGLDLKQDAEGKSGLSIGETEEGGLFLDGVSLTRRDGGIVIENAVISISPGERVLLTGASGSGKSTLVRALAGLWPWGSGEIRVAAGAVVGFVPQKPYLPLGTLRAALAYPNSGEELLDEEAKAALEDAGLGYLHPTLDEEMVLDQSLSGGERQRVAFARLLLQRPDIIILDEATAALDADSETRLMRLLFERLPRATILSVGHRTGLEALHTRKIVLHREDPDARVEQARARARSGAREWLERASNKIIILDPELLASGLHDPMERPVERRRKASHA